MLRKLISITIIVTIVIVGISFLIPDKNTESEFLTLEEYKIIETSINDVSISMYVADTQEKIVRGLSNIEKLEDDEGMIFIFPEERERIFWMKDMNFPLDILWFNSNNELVHMEENVLPENYPEKYGKGSVAQYVLEFNAGFVKNNNLSNLYLEQ